jgi:tryptophan 7-halogenase
MNEILVLGAGSAGLMAALALQRKLPAVKVRIVRSPELGVIGVGEGTTPLFPQFIFNYLGLDRSRFYREAEPTFKLGGRFLHWGRRPHFDYPFETTYDTQLPGLSRLNAWYADWDFSHCNLPCAMMARDKAFPRGKDGQPQMLEYFAFHIENAKFVAFLEKAARVLNIPIIDGKVKHVERGEAGVAALHLEDGRKLTADLYIDASGFRAELMRALEVPYRTFDQTLFCDRAVIGGWVRTDEPIKPYTTAETMDAGWAWQIEHEHFINRGYVFGSRFISDDEAREEFLRKNPKVPADSTRVVKFRSGRQAELWRGNVVAMGNAGGFVEPLEATALTIAAMHLKLLVQVLRHSNLQPTPTLRAIYNQRSTQQWDDTRDFLALHYRYNTALDTPFWKTCRGECDLGELVNFMEFYEENGPTQLAVHALPSFRAIYGLDGHFAMLSGQQVPWEKKPVHTMAEEAAWQRHASNARAVAENGMDIRETFAAMRAPGWTWKQPDVPARTTLQL